MPPMAVMAVPVLSRAMTRVLWSDVRSGGRRGRVVVSVVVQARVVVPLET